MKGVTKLQIELLEHVGAGGPDGDLDFDQLLDLLSWSPTKESAQFTIRSVVGKGLLLKLPELQLRRGRKRVCYRLTWTGECLLDPRKLAKTGSGTASEEVLDELFYEGAGG